MLPCPALAAPASSKQGWLPRYGPSSWRTPDEEGSAASLSVKYISSAVARRYASALLDLSLEKGNPLEIHRGLLEIRHLVQENRQLEGVLTNPAVGTTRKKKILVALSGRMELPELCRRLLQLLAERERIQLLPAIERAFKALWDGRRGVVSAEAVSAVALDAGQREALTAALAKMAGTEVDLQVAVDPTVLGGVVVKMGGRRYDGTVRGRLKAMRSALISPVAG